MRSERLEQVRRHFADSPAADRLREPLILLSGVVVVMALTRVLRSIVFEMQLTSEQFRQPIILLEVLRDPRLLLFVVVTTSILLLGRKRLRWECFEGGRSARVCLCLVALPLTWSFSTYDFNLYYNQLHLFDRLMLIASNIAMWVHPAAVPLFLVIACAIPKQFEGVVPVYYTWNDMFLLYNVLFLFLAYLFWKLIHRRSLHVFVFLVLCVICASYFSAGENKMTMNWFAENQLDNIIASGHFNGWFFRNSEEAALWWLSLVRPWVKPMMFAALAVELSALLILLWRRTAYVIIVNFVVFHCLILLTTGIFFWKWIWVDLVILGLLRGVGDSVLKRVFTWQGFALSIVIIMTADAYVEPFGPAWYDAKLNTYYRTEGVGESGTVYEIERRFFAPYDKIFGQCRFYFLTKDRHLVNTWGTVNNLEAARALENAEPTLAGIAAIENQLGEVLYDEGKISQLAAFLRQFFGNLNHRMSKKVVPAVARAPLHFMVFSKSGDREIYEMQEQLSRVLVYQVKWYYSGESFHQIEDRLVLSVEIPLRRPSDFNPGEQNDDAVRRPLDR